MLERARVYAEINLVRRNICALIKEVNQQKDMVLISVETCCFLLHGVEFVAWVFCIYYACQSDAQPDTRVLLFCHREPNANYIHEYTNMCANYANLRVRQVNWKPTANLHIGQLWHDFCAARAANIKKKNTQKYFVSMKSWNSLFLCLFSKTISLIFRKSIYALSMPTCSTPAQSCIKFQKNRWLSLYFQPSQPTHCGYF